MIRTLFSCLLLIFVALFFNSCASITSPTGGPRDQSPPDLESSSVPNGVVNFDSKTITLTFSEYIKLNNPAQNIYSSPPLGNSVSFTPRKNKLFITFKDSLEENTTYHLNFGNSIQDVNEGNSLNNFQFVFATGAQIDSLSISGKLTPVNDVKITDNTLIGLYKDHSDSAFLSKSPFYFTFVEEDGSFKLEYLKAGSYSLVALSDANNNSFYDLPNEAIGFVDSLIDLTMDMPGLSIPLFLPENAAVRVQSFTNAISEYKIEYELSSALSSTQSYKTYLISDSMQIESKRKISEERNKITSFLTNDFASLSSFQSVLEVGESIRDTFQHSISNLKKPQLVLSINGSEFTKNDSIILSLSSPMAGACENIALIDTLNRDTLGINAVQISDYQYFVEYPEAIQENIVYTLLIADSCFTSVWSQFLPRQTQNVMFVSEEKRGTLIFQFDGLKSEIDYLIELQAESGKLIQRSTVTMESDTWNITNLPEGTYKLKIIEDENRNGVWNSGSYDPKRFPEKIYEYDQEFIVRPNWELEENVNLDRP